MLLRGIAFAASLTSAGVAICVILVVYLLPRTLETARTYFRSLRGFTVSMLLFSNLMMAVITFGLTLALPTSLPITGSALRLCVAEGFFIQFLNTSAMVWTMLIGIVSTTFLMQWIKSPLWQRICCSIESLDDPAMQNQCAFVSARLLLLFIGFGLPAIIAFVALGLDMFGPPEDDLLPTWCWMNSKHPWLNLSFSYFSFYLVSLTVDIIFWVGVAVHFFQNHKSAVNRFFYFEILGYLFFFIVAYVFGFANRLLEYRGENEVFPLQICQVLFQSSILIPNLMLYLLSIYSQTDPFAPTELNDEMDHEHAPLITTPGIAP